MKINKNKKLTNYEIAEKYYYSGMTYKEIAQKIGVAEGTIKSWKVRHNWDSEKRPKKLCKVAKVQNLGNNSDEIRTSLLEQLEKEGKKNPKNTAAVERYIAIHHQFWKYSNDLEERGHIIIYENGKQVLTKKNESAELQLKAATVMDKIIENLNLKYEHDSGDKDENEAL